MSLNDYYIVSHKENLLSNEVNFDNVVIKKGEKQFLAEYYRNLHSRAKRLGMVCESGIDDKDRVWQKFTNSYKSIKFWFCNKRQALDLMVDPKTL